MTVYVGTSLPQPYVRSATLLTGPEGRGGWVHLVASHVAPASPDLLRTQSQSKNGSKLSSIAEVGILISKPFLPRRRKELTVDMSLSFFSAHRLEGPRRSRRLKVGQLITSLGAKLPKTSGCSSPITPTLMPEQMMCACIPGKKASAQEMPVETTDPKCGS